MEDRIRKASSINQHHQRPHRRWNILKKKKTNKSRMDIFYLLADSVRSSLCYDAHYTLSIFTHPDAKVQNHLTHTTRASHATNKQFRRKSNKNVMIYMGSIYLFQKKCENIKMLQQCSNHAQCFSTPTHSNIFTHVPRRPCYHIYIIVYMNKNDLPSHHHWQCGLLVWR